MEARLLQAPLPLLANARGTSAPLTCTFHKSKCYTPSPHQKLQNTSGFGRGSLSNHSSKTANRVSWSKPRKYARASHPPQANADLTAGPATEVNSDVLTFARICSILTTAFPVWVFSACVLALFKPRVFSWLQGPSLVWALAVTMLGMGTTISFEDFKGAFKMPRSFLAGLVLQYTVMPTLGYLVSKALGLPPHFAVGVILVACCPGGTASNIVTYLAGGEVALSVLMTAVSTFLAVFMTPWLTAFLAGKLVAVDAVGLFISTIQVVLLPVLGGACLARYFPGAVATVGPVAPLVAVFTVAGICGSAIGQSAAAIWQSGASILAAVVLLHLGGFFVGYVFSRLLGISERASRTISIEVGMQNSGLGVVLASQNFPNPLTAAPCAMSSVVHSVIGSLLAALWRWLDRRNLKIA